MELVRINKWFKETLKSLTVDGPQRRHHRRLVRAARHCLQRAQHRTARYLLGTPLLGDYLAEGVAQFGRSCAEFTAGT